LAAFVLEFGGIGEFLHGKLEVMLRRQSVQYHKTDVMSGKGIFRPDISQANDKVFHG
jgi:hypothetical protein